MRPPDHRIITCPKCRETSGNDWSQCNGVCPMEMSPYFKKEVIYTMTTTVIVKANHGWPVDVTPCDPAVRGVSLGSTTRVEPNTEQTFYVHGGQDLLIHEVQPLELVESKKESDA